MSFSFLVFHESGLETDKVSGGPYVSEALSTSNLHGMYGFQPLATYALTNATALVSNAGGHANSYAAGVLDAWQKLWDKRGAPTR